MRIPAYKRPTYTCKPDYFKYIDTPNKAYILGFIYADGHLTKNGELKIIIQKDDEEVLRLIKSELQSDSPIKIYKRLVKGEQKEYAGFSICRKSIAFDLKQIGIRHQKSSNNIIWPDKMCPTMMSHFLRGVFDGDGSIWQKEGASWACGFAGGFDFLSNIKTELTKNMIPTNPIRYSIGIHHPQACSLEISHRKNVKKLFAYLYNNANFYLVRKYQRFQNAFAIIDAWEKKKNFISEETERYILQLYTSKKRQKEIADILSMNYGTVRGCIQRMRRQNKCK